MKNQKLTADEIKYLQKIKELVEERLNEQLSEIYSIKKETREYYQRIIINKLIDNLDQWFQGYWDCIVDTMPDGSDLFYREMDCIQDHFETYIQGIKLRFYKN
jgi:hypothetical protein